jgi:hypothetical protein
MLQAVAMGSVQMQQGPHLAPRRSMAHMPLGGKNIFQLRAAAEVAETAQGESSSRSGQQQQQQQQQQDPNANPYAGVVLPTSDESEELLRIRHSVSKPEQFVPCMMFVQRGPD